MKTEVLCPAGEDKNPPFSPNPMDVLCRLQGNLRPAVSPSTGDKVVCCSEYVNCGVWKRHVDADRANSTKKQRDEHFAPVMHSGVMRSASRDTLRLR